MLQKKFTFLYMKTIFTFTLCLLLLLSGRTSAQNAIERFISASYMRGASVSLMIKDIDSDSIVYSYDADREVIPASVMKTVTTATALEILGENFRYETAIMYDGKINDSILSGNIYIRGSGDPTLGSRYINLNNEKKLRDWIKAIKNAGINTINGSIIADESIFDTEGISMKWMREDIGSYYGQGCYGLNIFDNGYSLFLNSGEPGNKPEIEKSEPELPSMIFHNYLTAANISKDSTFIVGFPYSNERYLYGIVPANSYGYKLRGDIPDPALFLAQYFTQLLKTENIAVVGDPICYRVLTQEENWEKPERVVLTTSFSPSLKEIVRITNFESNNLYADALLKTIGLQYRSEEIISSFGKGVIIINKHLKEKGLKTSSLWMFDGSGLAATDKITAGFLCDLLTYMATKSKSSTTFTESLPRAGIEGTVSNMLRGSALHGNARLKSGSMSRVRSYAGYITNNNKRYAVVVIVNNFSCNQSQIKNDIEQLLLSLFK